MRRNVNLRVGMMASGIKAAGVQNRRLNGTGEPNSWLGADQSVVVMRCWETGKERRG